VFVPLKNVTSESDQHEHVTRTRMAIPLFS
jgi:hypothetical protein